LYKGSLGSQISVPNKSRGQGVYVLLDYVFPENFHEFDICIFDLTNPPAKTYKPAENIIEGAHRQEVYALYCQYPTTVFDSRPFAAALIPQNIESIQERPFLQIIFACSQYESQYEPVLITNDYHSTQNKETRTIYNFSSEIPLGQVRRGKEVKLRPMNPLLSSFLGKYQKDFTYEQTFRHAQRPTQRFGSEDDPSFIPLLENINGEIVSFGENAVIDHSIALDIDHPELMFF
jgi:hypothetical protein